MPPPPENSTTNTPLAPSVEKAYYRKCIELKRRLNEVEAANDEAKVRRVRLDRGVMKMRLERAFLLDELRKRMEHNVDGSEGSGDEGMATPPPDRPHRDRRKRHHLPIQRAGRSNSQSSHAPQQHPPGSQQRPPYSRVASHTDPSSLPLVPGPGGASVRANARNAEGNFIYVPPHELSAMQGQPGLPSYHPYQQPPNASSHGAPVGLPDSADRHMNGMSYDGVDDGEHPAASTNRESAPEEDGMPAGSGGREESNGDQRALSGSAGGNAGGGGAGFTAVNR